MKVVIVNKSDSTGGAAVVSYRLMQALCQAGIDARMLVAEKRSVSPRVAPAASSLSLKRAFLMERLGIFMHNGMNRATLFKIDTAADGVDISRHPWVREADIICLNWINQGLLSFRGLERLARTGKPIVWTMHDMWNMTGVCHHAGDCDRWQEHCGLCPLLGRCAGDNDISTRVWQRKKDLYTAYRPAFVAVSSWLADRARRSSLMAGADITVIPNAFHFADERPVRPPHSGIRIVFGAARLDDSIKGLPIMVRATEMLAAEHPDIAAECKIVTFGNVRNPEAIQRFGIPHEHLGVIAPSRIQEAYLSADMVVSTSLYETLPGTLVEGQAWGCVPVTLDRGGQRDIVDHQQTGYLAHWSEDGDYEKAARAIAEGMTWAYKELKRDADGLRERMLQSALRRFSAGTVAGKYIHLFERLTGATRQH